jgi:hypothetical protein
MRLKKYLGVARYRNYCRVRRRLRHFVKSGQQEINRAYAKRQK